MLVVRKIGEQVDEHGVRRCVLQDEYGGTILATYTEIAEEIRAGELKFADSQEEIGKVKKSETQRKEHMIKAKCISKNRDSKGVIQSYTLQDVNGATMNVTGQQIKKAITKGQIDIVNLQIDRAGRLIDKSIETSQAPKTSKARSSSISIEQQAEIFIKFIKDIKKILEEDNFHFETKNEAVEEQIYYQCVKKYPNRIFTYDRDELYNKHRYSPSGRVDWTAVRATENEVHINQLFANFIFGNLKKVDIQLADNWYERHETDLVMDGQCTLEEMEELIEEEDDYGYKVCKEAEKIIETYKTKYNMRLDYEIDCGYLEITGVVFK